ncbi:hypothetical protein MGYG_04391 [Nannizzia gypsea CBS 118893]|uniref:F-box domain-containing protein n=1 Tax=Arthroderma gypseum (strain ATCC MYA-4604 / CBS 118893) TaxID=535722 RepID=E4UST5_ARTGP|nr:hypothetical protein MGYG_04391 [Nannizzia gypsea CBS 118893]EFR01384.1 hypothetical protein MGYG_04391 [Nannizzia gypsea CBS 118893]
MAARKVFAIPELVHLIVEQAEWYERRQLLTISRLFQAAVEPSVWRGYTFRTDSSAEEFLEKYHGHRSRYLRSIDIHIDFPTQVATDGNEIPCRETAKDLQSYNELFTRQILALFTMLKTLEDRELPQNRPRDINLCLRIYRLYRGSNKECHHRERLSWRLCLLTHKDLPTLSSVISLRLSQDEYKDDNGAPKVNLPSTPQPLDFGAISSLVSKLPNLDNLEGEWHEDDWQVAYEYAVLIHFTRPWEGPWRDSRHTFGNIIRNAATLLTKIRRIKLEFCRTYAFKYHDQSLPLPNLISPLSYDPFSSGLRIISQRVVNLAIRACVDRNLFWPLDSEGKVESPSWPYLKNLHVEFEPMSPSGIWYFQGPRGEGREANTPFEITQAHYPPVGENPQDKHWDEIWIREWGQWENMQPNIFRITPIDETIELFLEAFIKALEKMPLLEEVELFTRMKFAPDEDLYDTYDADEEKEYLWGLRYLLPKDGGNPLLEWHIGDWRPSERLLQRFHDIAAHRSGNPLEERWVDWKQCNIHSFYRHSFESFSSVTYME